MNTLIEANSQKNCSYTSVLAGLSRKKMIGKIQFYGFIECARMLRFLSTVVESEVIDIPSLKYLLANLNECIEKHAKGYTDANTLSYFRSLFELRDEIEFIASISNK